MKKSFRSRALASTVITAAALWAVPLAASAQVTPDQNAPTVGPNAPSTGSTASADGSAAGSAAPSALSEVVVTGTRIRSPNLTSNSPLSVVNTQELKFEGTTQVEQLINQLPQFTPGQSQQQSNGSSGTATLNLRGLGSTRTLVLVDGRRLQPGDPVTIAPDINNIPAAMVDRIETISGGASAVYGSDAISGVVNFILKKNFEGIQLDTQYSFYNHQQGNPLGQKALSKFGLTAPGDVGGDGQTWDASILIGANSPDDKGNVTFYATYRNLQPVTQDSRDYSACSLATDFAGSLNCAGSSNSAFGRFDGTAAGGSVTNSPTGKTFTRYTSARAFNYGPFNFLQRNDDRYNAGAFAHYKLNNHIEVYGDLMFTDDRSFAQIAPSGLFRGTGPNGGATYSINCDNPLLSGQQATTLCGANAGVAGTVYNNLIGYRFANLPRQDDLRHTNYRIDVGARGEIAPGWSYDAYLQYGTTLLSENYRNDVSVSRVQDALLVGRNAAGQPTCLSVIANGGGACVPLDIFQATSQGLTPAALAYVITPGFQSAQVTEQVASINLSGDLGQYGVKSPLASDGIGIALGTEYRREALDYRTDAEFTSGDLSGQGGPRIGNAGQFDVYEIFGEARVPLIQNLPFVHDLTFDGGYRFSDYSTVGTTNAYKGELSYAPIRELRFRATYNRAVRAPNIVELFTPTSVGLGSFTDPCAIGDDGAAPSATLAACQRTGLTAALYNGGVNQCPAGQCSILTGGNTLLKPEVADTYTAGFVWTPTNFFGMTTRGLNFSVDYFDITVKDYISAVSPSTSLTQCLTSGSPYFCGQVRRDPQLGILFGSAGYVSNTNLNTGLLRTRGIDVTANYTTRLQAIGFGGYHPLPDWGTLAFSYLATYTDEQTTKPLPGFVPYNCRGLYGPTCGQPTPAYKHQFRATWNTPWDLAVSARWRYLSGSKLDAIQANTNLNQGITLADVPEDAKIGAYGYLDLSATWQIRRKVQLRVGVNNVFDRDPPVLDSNNIPVSNPAVFGNANTFPGVYDSLGRQIFMGLTANF